MKSICICFLLFLLHISSSYRSGYSRFKYKKCEKVKIKLCQEIGYNLTYMPNQFGHKTQFDADLIIQQFVPLVVVNCSPLLKHFVCSLYAPMCDPVFNKEILPCRSLCEDVRDKCAPVLEKTGLQWPEHLSCSKFPTRKMNNICMKPESEPDTASNIVKTPKGVRTTNRKPSQYPNRHNTASGNVLKNGGNVWQSGGCGCECKPPFVQPNKTVREIDGAPLCALPCKLYYFKKNQTNIITFWLGFWSVIAFIASFLTVITFLLDRARFDYTEHPIILIAFCYILVSSGYIIRMIVGHEVIACNSHTNLVHYSTTGPAQCTAVFIFTYFFSNASRIWWVILSINWFLSSGLKWSSDAISCYSQYCHFVAWFVPTVQTMAILAMAAIDGDPVSGLCSVGNHDNQTLLIFVITPLLVYAMLALSFLVAGVIAVSQSEKILGTMYFENSTKTRVKYISKTAILIVTLLVSNIALVACYFYEHNNRELWEKSITCPCMKEKIKPNFYVFSTKYFMTLWIGLVAGLWLLESRTIEIWKKVLKRLFGKNHCQHENNNLLGNKNPTPVLL